MTVSCGLAPLSTIKVSAGKHKQPLSFSLSNTNTPSKTEHLLKSTERLWLHPWWEAALSLSRHTVSLIMLLRTQTQQSLRSRFGLRAGVVWEYFGGWGKCLRWLGPARLSHFWLKFGSRYGSIQLSMTARQDCVLIQTIWINLIRLCWRRALWHHCPEMAVTGGRRKHQ